MTDSKFEQWAVVEIMGHKKFAGRVTEQSIGGVSFIRVDVPEISLKPGDVLPAFTKCFGAAAIYCITVCTEDTAKQFAASFRAEAFAKYELPKMRALPSHVTDPDNGTDEFDDDPDHEPPPDGRLW